MAAEQYIHGAREIVRRRSDAERLAREAAMSRRALTMHMAVAHQRDTYWIRVASDLKKRVEREHHDLDVSLKALTHLLDELPATRKELAPHIDASLLLEEEERRKAHAHAEQSAQRGSGEIAKIRHPSQPRSRWCRGWVFFAVTWIVVAAIQVGVILATADEPEKALQPFLLGIAVPALLYVLGWVVERLKRKP